MLLPPAFLPSSEITSLARAMDTEWLRIVVVGHVDHGKSSLIGRLLHESGALPDGRLEEIARGAQDGLPEWALLLDHFSEEREQERTIDSTQAFFATASRVYRIIDAPGHREFLKNMVTGAAQADAAILVVDVEAGVLEQTRRHVAMLAMLGLRCLIVAINKMDRVGGKRGPFDAVSSSVLALLRQADMTPQCVVPISAKHGWELAGHAPEIGWYDGPTLFEALDSLPKPAHLSSQPLRFPVQDVYEINGRKIIVGRIESGRIARGESLMCLPTGQTVRVATIEKFMEDRTSAKALESIGLTIEEPLHVERGMVLCDLKQPPRAAGQFEANVFWLARNGWARGDSLLLRCTTQQSPCQIERVRRRVNSSTFEVVEDDASHLDATEVAEVVLSLDQPIAVEEFGRGKPLRRFVLIKNGELSAGGTVTSAPRLAK